MAGEVRSGIDNFTFDPKYFIELVRIAVCLKKSIEYASIANANFFKIPSNHISPDGAIGGKGYTLLISEARQQMAETVSLLSSLQDSFTDEVTSTHWKRIMEDNFTGDQLEDIERLLETL